jgi:hypothetical protein
LPPYRRLEKAQRFPWCVSISEPLAPTRGIRKVRISCAE